MLDFTQSHKGGFEFPGKKCQKCFDCNKVGYFKGAPICKKPKGKKPAKKEANKDTSAKKEKKTRSRQVKDKDTSSDDMEDTEGELTNSCGRVMEVVGRSLQCILLEPKVSLRVKLREGGDYIGVYWLPDRSV